MTPEQIELNGAKALTSKNLESVRKYRESPKGLLVKMYRAMRSRNSVGFTLKEFQDRFLNDKKFIRLHSEWLKSGKNKNKIPSLDRILRTKGYTVENTQMLTWEENNYRQKMERRHRSGVIIKYLDGLEVAKYKSLRDASVKTGISYGNIQMCVAGKRKTCEGFSFLPESKVKERMNLSKDALDQIEEIQVNFENSIISNEQFKLYKSFDKYHQSRIYLDPSLENIFIGYLLCFQSLGLKVKER